MPTNDITHAANDQLQDATDHLTADREAYRQFTLTMVLDRLRGDPQGALADEDCRERLQLAWQRADERVAVQLALSSSPKLARVHAKDLWAMVGVDTKVVPLHPTAIEQQDELALTYLSEIEPEPMQWLWWPYIPRGCVVLLDGDPGVGKSFLTNALGAAFSMGHALPDCQGVQDDTVIRPPANSLFFATEDSLSHTVRPRFDAMEADLGRIAYVKGIPEAPGIYRQFTLAEPQFLRKALDKLNPLLVVIDPIQAYLGSKVDMYRPNEVRPLMNILAGLAEEYQCTFLCLRHLAKSSGNGTIKTMMRGLGSIDFGGIARSILFCDKHPVMRDLSIMLQVKSNVGVFGRTQVFSKARGRFQWAGVTRLNEEAVQQATGRDFYRAFMWLEHTLSSGIAQPAKDLQLQAKEEMDLDPKPLYAARTAMGAKLSRQGFGEGSTVFWQLPGLDIMRPSGDDEDTHDDVPF